MASFVTNWDSSTDKIYVSYSEAPNTTLDIVSDPNTGVARTKILHVSTGNITRNIVINQAGTSQTHTVRLVPSNYSVSNSSYVAVTNPTYMYGNTDDTSDYASLRGRVYSSGSARPQTYYVFIYGFDFRQVPVGATVTGFRVLISARRNRYQNTGSNYRIRLASSASSNSQISGTILSSDVTNANAPEVYEIPTGTLTWDDVCRADNFCIEVPLCNNNAGGKSTYPYVYVYGAEIEVTYTL